MTVRIATMNDLSRIVEQDRHISPEELKLLISLGRVAVAEDGESFLGWMRWNLFWDNTPFLNMLYLLEPHRGKGYGKTMMAWWEREMHSQGFDTLMTSTASDEYAQHFYQKLGYSAVGGFALPGEVYELIFVKNLK